MAILVLGLAAGCADDFPQPIGDSYAADTQLVLKIAVPQPPQAATRADYSAAADECAINSMRLIGFSETGSVINRALAVSSVPVANDGTQAFEINNIEPGNYLVYVVANVPDNLLSSINSESALKEVILNYTGNNKLTAGNLPMIYEPSSSTRIEAATAGSATVKTLSMKFACAKVKFNIIFDKALAETQSVFGDAGLMITGMQMMKVSQSAHLTELSSYLPATHSYNVSGDYFDGYTYTPSNADKSNADVVTGSSKKGSAPSSYSTRWLYQGTLYLPERNAKNAAEQTQLSFTAAMPNSSKAAGNVKCEYKINLGSYDGAPANTFALSRNTYYEVVAIVKSLTNDQNASLSTKMVAKDWMNDLITTDFVHTYLNLSKTELKVKSLENDTLTFATDGRGEPQIVCETKLPTNGPNPVIRFEYNSASKTYIVKANPQVDITAVSGGQRKGNASCYIQAGNIRKYFTVHFDLTPFFEIEPLEHNIDYTDDQAGRTREFKYTTNLGGIRLAFDGTQSYILQSGRTSTSHTSGNSQITLSCSNPDAAEGVIKVVLNKDPGTTTFHYLDAYPAKHSALSAADKTSLGNNGMRDLTVKTMTKLSDYRIYFRAINDYHSLNYNSNDVNFKLTSFEFLNGTNSNFPTEGSGTWVDWWNAGNGADRNADVHKMYIYTQYGETIYGGYDGKQIISPVWKFTPNYENGGSNMTPDDSKPGWYYLNLGVNAEGNGSYTDNVDKEIKERFRHPVPGETLLIFYNGYDLGDGATLHRAPHHLDPGISLFDYEDREGYYIYDPTSEPYYYVFDEKPQIDDVTYRIASNSPVVGWYKTYGYNKKGGTYTVWSNHIDSSNGFYTIKLKAPHGRHAKGIIIKFQNGKEAVLFNGRQYTNDTGYFNANTSQWSQSKNY